MENDNWRDFLEEVHKQNEEARINSLIYNAEKYGDSCDTCKIEIKD